MPYDILADRGHALVIMLMFFSGTAAYDQDLFMRVEIAVAQSTANNNEESLLQNVWY
jgi:hypothetical protein